MKGVRNVTAKREKDRVMVSIPCEEIDSLRIFTCKGNLHPKLQTLAAGGIIREVKFPRTFKLEKKIGITAEAKNNLHISTREFANLLNSRGKRAFKYLGLLEENLTLADVVVLKDSDFREEVGPGTVCAIKETLLKKKLGLVEDVTEELLNLARECRIDSLK